MSSLADGEVKTLMMHLLSGVIHLHDNWIIHRDLKTSNLLLSPKGILKIGDFGLAREYGSPLKNYTPIVVTLWYHAPELILGLKAGDDDDTLVSGGFHLTNAAKGVSAVGPGFSLKF